MLMICMLSFILRESGCVLPFPFKFCAGTGARAAKIDPSHMPDVPLRLTAVLLFRNCSLITPELLTKTKTWLGKVQYNEKLESN